MSFQDNIDALLSHLLIGKKPTINRSSCKESHIKCNAISTDQVDGIVLVSFLSNNIPTRVEGEVARIGVLPNSFCHL